MYFPPARFAILRIVVSLSQQVGEHESRSDARLRGFRLLWPSIASDANGVQLERLRVEREYPQVLLQDARVGLSHLSRPA